MVTITLYAKQKKRHRCTEQTFGLCGKRRGWDVLREQHRNMHQTASKHILSRVKHASNSIETYIIKGETDHQPRLDA